MPLDAGAHGSLRNPFSFPLLQFLRQPSAGFGGLRDSEQYAGPIMLLFVHVCVTARRGQTDATGCGLRFPLPRFAMELPRERSASSSSRSMYPARPLGSPPNVHPTPASRSNHRPTKPPEESSTVK
eukprot:11820601-Alexandrium_andersonii.AAC.1